MDKSQKQISPAEILKATMQIVEASNQPHQTVKICLAYLANLLQMLEADAKNAEPTDGTDEPTGEVA